MKQPETVTLILADDHPVFRKGLREIIDEEPRFIVAGEAGDGEEAWRLIETLAPAIAVLDIEMPKADGIEVAERMQKLGLSTRAVILTMYKDESVFNRALDAGVYGYLLKEVAVPDVLDAIDTVARGEYYISPALTSHAMRHHHPFDGQARQRSYEQLSQTEKEVLRLIAAAQSTKQIAELMHVSPRTVEHHRHNICQKLEISGSYALLRFALEHRSREPGTVDR